MNDTDTGLWQPWCSLTHGKGPRIANAKVNAATVALLRPKRLSCLGKVHQVL
jgi:hypothetical protein